jgi:non-histone chromosomal protein 6
MSNDPFGPDGALVLGNEKKKDPNAPKRPLTSFMHFSQDQRAAVMKANPDASFGELGHLLGAKWRKTTTAQKKKYEAKAATDKVRYTKAMAAYEGQKIEE